MVTFHGRASNKVEAVFEALCHDFLPAVLLEAGEEHRDFGCGVVRGLVADIHCDSSEKTFSERAGGSFFE